MTVVQLGLATMALSIPASPVDVQDSEMVGIDLGDEKRNILLHAIRRSVGETKAPLLA
jgi:hypothetical protein